MSLSEHFAGADSTRGGVQSHRQTQSLCRRSPAPEDWVQAQVQVMKDDDLTLIWLRQRIAEGRWTELATEIGWLSAELRQQDRWRYWLARSREATGDTADELDGIWRDLATERSFHGFLAADRLGLPCAERACFTGPDTGSPPRLGGVSRAQELLAIGEQRESKEQWRHTINQLPRELRSRLGEIASLGAGLISLPMPPMPHRTEPSGSALSGYALGCV